MRIAELSLLLLNICGKSVRRDQQPQALTSLVCEQLCRFGLVLRSCDCFRRCSTIGRSITSSTGSIRRLVPSSFRQSSVLLTCLRVMLLCRPVANDSETVTVQIAFNLQQIINLVSLQLPKVTRGTYRLSSLRNNSNFEITRLTNFYR